MLVYKSGFDADLFKAYCYMFCLFLQDQLVINVEALRAENDQVRLRATSLHHRYQNLTVVHFFFLIFKSHFAKHKFVIAENTLISCSYKMFFIEQLLFCFKKKTTHW